MTDINELIRAVERDKEEQLRSSAIKASSGNPEQSAKVYDLARRHGLPYDYVERNYDRVSAPSVGDLPPRTADFLRDRRKAQITIDDIENLSWWETAAKEGKNLLRMGPAAAYSVSSAGYASLGSIFNALSAATIAPVRSLGLATEEEIKRGDWLGATGNFLLDVARGEQQYAQEWMPSPDETSIPQPVLAGVQSAATNIPMMLAGVVTRNPNLALGGMGGVTYGGSYLRAKDAGLDELNALVYAVNDTLAEVVTERLPMTRLLDDIGADAGFFRMVAGQMATEIPQEQIATIWQDANEWASINPDKTLREFLDERKDAAIDTLIATVVAAGLQTSTIYALNSFVERQEKAAIDEIATKAKESKLNARSADLFVQHVQELAEEYQSVDNVYLDAEAARTLFQDLKQDAARDLIAAQLDEAVALGGDIVIPIGEFASFVATSENYGVLRQHFRLSPESPNKADLGEAQVKNVLDLIKEANENIEMRTRADEIFNEVSSQLIQTGRLSPDAAKYSASIIPAYVTSRAVRSGLSVDQIYEMMGLRIIGPDADLKRSQGLILDQARQQGYEGESMGEALEWRRAYEKFGPEGMTQEARLARAREMGFDTETVYYHGSRADFEEFAPSESGLFGPGVYTTKKPHQAASYGDIIYPVYIASRKPISEAPFEAGDTEIISSRLDGFLVDDYLTPYANWVRLKDTFGADRATEAFRAAGYDALEHKSYKIPFSAQQLRTIHAAFDPDFADSPRLLAQSYTPEDLDFFKSQGLLTEEEAANLQSYGNQTDSQSGAARTISGDLPREQWAEATAIKADGSPAVVYRGAAQPLSASDFDNLGRATGHPSAALGVWFSSDQADAAAYGSTSEYRLDIRNPKVYTLADDIQVFDSPEGYTQLREQLQAEGFDGIVLDYSEVGGPQHIVAFEPNQVIEAGRDLFQSGNIGYMAETSRGDRSSTTPTPERSEAEFVESLEQIQGLTDDAAALADELLDNGARIATDGTVLLYHRTTPASAQEIRNTGKMTGKEDGLFFSTAPDGQIEGYGEAVVELRIPLSELMLDDVFGDEAHVRLPTSGAGSSVDVSNWIPPLQDLPAVDRFLEQARADGFDVDTVWLHGSENEFTEFDPSRRGSNYDDDASRAGVFLTNSQDAADFYGPKTNRFLVRKGRHHEITDEEISEHIERWLDELEQTDPQEAEFQRETKAYANSQGINKGFELAILAAKDRGFDSVSYTESEYDETTLVVFDDENIRNIPPSDGVASASPDQSPRSQGADDLYQGAKAGPRGVISLLPQESIIQLTKASDLTTFLHESAHLFLEMEGRLFNHPNATDDIKRDGQIILDYLGADSFESITTEQHETFARSFEQYLGEGKAPSVELQSVFRRFAAWIKQVYRSLSRLNVDLSDEMRQVFDRMLATDDQIDRMKGRFHPLFESAEDAGATEAEYRAYQNKATPDVAKEQLRAKLLKQLERQHKKWWRDESAIIAKGIREELLNNPVYQVVETIRGGEFKLSRSEVKEVLGVSKLPSKFNGLTAEGGRSLDEISALYGISPHDLVTRINNEPTLKQAVDQATHEEMVRRHGDALTDGTLEQLAEQAAHDTEYGKKLATELAFLARKTGQPAIDRQAVKEHAKQQIGSLPYKRIYPNRYRANEIRSARAAVEAKMRGDNAAALLHKQQELVNFYLAKEAQYAKDKAQKIRASLKAIQTRKYDSKKVDTEMVNQAKVLIAAYDFRKNNKDSADLAEARLASVRNWIASQQKDPESVTTFVEAEVLGKLIPYDEMTFEDLRGVDDVVKSIMFGARRAMEADSEAYKKDIAEGAEYLKENRIETYQTEIDSDTPWVRVKATIRDLFASLRKMESLVRQADGMNEQGWLWKRTIKPLLDAANNALEMRTQAHAALNEIFQGYEGAFNGLKDRRTFTLDSGRKITMSYGARISLALNMGNESNLEALLSMGMVTPDSQPMMTTNDINTIVATLSDKDWDLVQNIWDYIDTFWPQISELEVKRSGVAPQKVQPREFVTPTGKQMKGGYYPLVGDPLEDSKQMDQDISAQADVMKSGGAAKKSTRHGSTIERVGFGGKKIDFSLNVLFNHIDGVIHDITHWEAIRDSDRILRNPKIYKELETSLGKAGARAIKDRLVEVAAGPQRINGLRGIQRVLRHARLASTYGALGYSVRTALMNTLGLTTAMGEMDARTVAAGVAEYYGNKRSSDEFILSKSKYMRDRGEVLTRDVAAIRSSLRGDTRWNQFRDHAFWLMTQTDKAITRPIWLAAYRQGESMFDTEQAAIDHADRMVARTQGSGFDMDLANVETRNELMKTMTVMYSAMSAIYNITTEQIKRKKAGKINAVELTAKLAWLLVIPGIIEMLMTGGADEDELVKDTATSVAVYSLGIIPIARDVASYAEYGSAFPSPIIQLGKAPVDFVKQASQGEIDKGFLRATTDMLAWGLVPGTAQFNRTAGYLIDLNEGEIDEFSVYDLIVTGKESK